MDRKQLKKIVKENKEQVYSYVENYLEPKVERDSGQLKCLKSLLVRNVAISTTLREATKKRVFDFLDEIVLSDEEDVIDFFNKEKNIDLFLESPYGCGMEHSEYAKYLDDFETEKVFPKFLLLQKVQAVMESELVMYINSSQKTEERQIEIEETRREVKRKEEEQAATCETVVGGASSKKKKVHDMEFLTYKKDAYLNFLFSVAIYEIMVMKTYEEFDVEAFYKKGDSCRLYMMYVLRHLTNLYAIIRIVYLIEFVQSNGMYLEDTNPKKSSGKKNDIYVEAYKKAIEWMHVFEDWDLFCIVSWKKNLAKMYAELDATYFRVFKEDEKLEYIETLKQYFSILEHRLADQRSGQEERQIWNLQIKLAGPIWNEVGTIMDFQKNG